jgi:CrcB protein
LRDLLFIALGGALGAVSRYAVSGWAHDLLGTAFPYGTLVVNVAGCFLLGLIAHVGQTTVYISEPARIAATIGFLGGLTTFSTFGYETFRQLEDGQWVYAVGNMAANLFVGLLAVWAGLAAARIVVGGA